VPDSNSLDRVACSTRGSGPACGVVGGPIDPCERLSLNLVQEEILAKDLCSNTLPPHFRIDHRDRLVADEDMHVRTASRSLVHPPESVSAAASGPCSYLCVLLATTSDESMPQQCLDRRLNSTSISR
jgi:hypothetical protein